MQKPGMKKRWETWHKRGERRSEGGGRAGRAVNQNKTKSSKFGPSTSAFHRRFPPLQHSYINTLRWQVPPYSVFLANHSWSSGSMCTRTFSLLSGRWPPLCAPQVSNHVLHLQGLTQRLNTSIKTFQVWRAGGKILGVGEWLSSFYNYRSVDYFV